MRDLTLILKNTRNNIVLPFKSSLVLDEKSLPEQDPNAHWKFFQVEVEYEVRALIYGRGINVALEMAGEDFGSESVDIKDTIIFKGKKTFEIEATDEAAAKKRFEGVSEKNVDLSVYAGDEYMTEGFSVDVDSVHVKVISIEELPE